MKHLKSTLKVSLVIAIVSVISIYISDFVVKRKASGKVYTSTNDIPYNRVGLLLGTGKILSNGQLNLYYQYRIEAAVALYKSGKIDYILVSGDNSSKNYDEPSTMKEDLIKMGVPARKIFLDYAGFRTLDSVVRSNNIFGQNSLTVISQRFHNERAIFIASHKGINAVGFNAQDVSHRYGFKTSLRENFARVKMIIDLLIGVKPKFLGESVVIE